MLHIVFLDNLFRAIVGERGQGLEKNFSHHGWPSDKILGCEWPKTAQMALKIFYFFRNIFNLFRIFLVCQNNFCEPFSFYKGFFYKNPENYEKVWFKISINFYIKSFTVATCL